MKSILVLFLLVIVVNCVNSQFQEESFNQQTSFQEESAGRGGFQEESFNQDTSFSEVSFGRRRR